MPPAAGWGRGLGMRNEFRRPALAAVAGMLGLAGIAATIIGNSATSGEAAGQYTIAITDTGFNPDYCIVRRMDSFRWVNKGTVPHHVVSVALKNNDERVIDTGVLQPGQTSSGYVVGAKSIYAYYDRLNPELKGTVDAGDRPASCAERPPTPTPTPTPSVSPTLTPTRTPAPPTATPTPDPRKAYFSNLARDED